MPFWIRGISCTLLLVWCLLTSQCVICPDMRASQASPHDCCKPATPDHCGKEKSQDQCPGHSPAFESSPKADTAQPLALASGVLPLVAVAWTAPAPLSRGEDAVSHPPPDRCLLNSVLLI
ncbi:MAG TPA: hypothetical protein VLH09_14820 [Bryobacteraceae bacterium]|nr:hypothetical protein [Bryobacteraceae bacterium]